jgi:hypothetical protein
MHGLRQHNFIKILLDASVIAVLPDCVMFEMSLVALNWEDEEFIICVDVQLPLELFDEAE